MATKIVFGGDIGKGMLAFAGGLIQHYLRSQFVYLEVDLLIVTLVSCQAGFLEVGPDGG